MATKLSVYNNALLALGERKLSSLSENREARRALDDVWDGEGVIACLERGLWNFAIRTVELTYTPDLTASFGYRWAFDKPTDFVRLAGLCSDEFFKVPLLEYRDEAGYWFADLEVIYVSYVSKDTNYGLDLSRWPVTFTRYVESLFASRVCLRLTGDKQKKLEMDADVKRYLDEAKAVDAMDNPTQMLPAGSWLRARAGRRSRLDRGNRSSLIG